jgi:hypothetical protein
MIINETFIIFLIGTIAMFLFRIVRQNAVGRNNSPKISVIYELEQEMNSIYLPQASDNSHFIMTLEKSIVWSVAALFVGGLLGHIVIGILYANAVMGYELTSLYGTIAGVVSVVAMLGKIRFITFKWNYLDANTDSIIFGEKYPCQIIKWGVKTENGFFGKSHFLLCKYAYTRDKKTVEGIFRVEVPVADFNPENEGTDIWLHKGDTAKYISIIGLGRYREARIMLRTRKDAFDKMETDDY